MRSNLELATALARDLGIPLLPAARILGRLQHGLAASTDIQRIRDVATVASVARAEIGSTAPAAFLEGVVGPALANDRMNEIENGFADVMWADLWASKEEECGRTYSSNLVDEAPAMMDEAVVEAVVSVAMIESASRMTGDEIWDAGREAQISDIRNRVAPNAVAGEIAELDRLHTFSRRSLGNNLYYEMAGVGLRWSDDYAEIPGLTVPSREIMLDCIDEGDYPLNRTLAIRIAEGYASGMHAADPGWHLYAFASTGGIVQSEEHRRHLLAHLEGECMEAARMNDQAGDTEAIFGGSEEADIQALIEFVKQEPVLALENRYRRGTFYGAEPVELEIPNATPAPR